MASKKEPTKKLTVEQLEEILHEDEEAPLEILPNGEVRYAGCDDLESAKKLAKKIKAKPLVAGQNVGANY